MKYIPMCIMLIVIALFCFSVILITSWIKQALEEAKLEELDTITVEQPVSAPEDRFVIRLGDGDDVVEMTITATPKGKVYIVEGEGGVLIKLREDN